MLLSECLSDIDEVLQEGCDVILVGDTNFECDIGNEGYKQCFDLFSKYHVYNNVMISFYVLSALHTVMMH